MIDQRTAANDSPPFQDTMPTNRAGWSISFLRQRIRQRQLARKWSGRFLWLTIGAALALALAYCGGPA